MSFDGSVQCWIPDVPITQDTAWRMKIAKFGDGYEQRMLDGINALGLEWSLQWINRTKDDLLAMDAYLANQGATSFLFREPASGVIYTVFCNEWTIEWAPARRGQGTWIYYGSLTAKFEKANGVGLPGGTPGGGYRTVVSDTFTAINGTLLVAHAGEIGATWSLFSGTAPQAQIDNNRVWPAGGPNVYFASGIPPSLNYYVEGEFDFVELNPTDDIGIAGRIAGTAFYFVRFSQAANNWALFRSNAGVDTQLGGGYADAFTSDSRIVRLDMAGAVISVWIDGFRVISVTDAAPLLVVGSAGIRAGNIATAITGRHITRFEAVAPL